MLIMELQNPAATYRAPFPFVPVITPGKTYYKLSSMTERNQVMTALGCTHAEHIFLKGQDEKTGADQSGLGQRWSVEQTADDVGHCDRGSRWTEFNEVPAVSRITSDGFNLSLSCHAKERMQPEGQVNSMMRQEERFSRWVVVMSKNRRLSDRGAEVRNEGEFLNSCLLHTRRRSDEPNQCHIPCNWRLPSEVERSWNKSPRPIADLIYNYERTPVLKMGMPESRKSLRLSMSSRFPVSEMAERYMQSRRQNE